MPGWLIALIVVGGYLAGIPAMGVLLSYLRGKYDIDGMYDDDIVMFSALWPFGLVAVFVIAVRPFWDRLVHPMMHAWESAEQRGKNSDERKQARAAKRKAKQDEKRAEHELRREFVDLCKQNGWDPKQVLKNKRAA